MSQEKRLLATLVLRQQEVDMENVLSQTHPKHSYEAIQQFTELYRRVGVLIDRIDTNHELSSSYVLAVLGERTGFSAGEDTLGELMCLPDFTDHLSDCINAFRLNQFTTEFYTKNFRYYTAVISLLRK